MDPRAAARGGKRADEAPAIRSPATGHAGRTPLPAPAAPAPGPHASRAAPPQVRFRDGTDLEDRDPLD
jgi:hypothetical protein